MSQNLNQIAILAAAMREAQRAYFRRRTPDLLVAAKQAEAALDKALAALGEVDDQKDDDLRDALMAALRREAALIKAFAQILKTGRLEGVTAPTALGYVLKIAREALEVEG